MRYWRHFRESTERRSTAPRLLFPPRREHFREALLLVCSRSCYPAETSCEDGESEGAAGSSAPGGREARRGGGTRPCAPRLGAGPPTSLGRRSRGKGEVQGGGWGRPRSLLSRIWREHGPCRTGFFSDLVSRGVVAQDIWGLRRAGVLHDWGLRRAKPLL